MDKKAAKLLLKIKAVTLRVNPPYTWASGIKSPIYTDNRLLMSYPKERDEIVSHFLTLIKQNKLKPDVIAGIATSGIPWAAWIAAKLKLPLVYIRKKKKGHGKQNLIEGKLKKGRKVIIVEDLISTGGSSINGVKAVKAAGCTVLSNLAIFTYGLEQAKESFDKEKTLLLTLTNLHTLIDAAVENKYITETEKEQILEWHKAPKKWKK